MKIERLNKKRTYFLYALTLGVVLLIILSINESLAKYKTTQSIPIAKGEISYTPYDFKIIAMYQENDNNEYTEITNMPANGYYINEEKSYCTLDNKNADKNAKIYTTDNGEHIINALSKNEKCYIWFDKDNSICENACETILANKTIGIRTDYSTLASATTNGVIFKTRDNDGTSYYFAGAPTDNYVKFGGFYWRIIRINGNGSIRLIYAGEVEEIDSAGKEIILANGYNDGITKYTSIGTSSFNEYNDDSAYIGYMYGTPASNSYETTHLNSNDSKIKEILDNWYEENLKNYENYIEFNVGFCNDRTAYTDRDGSISGGGTGTIFTVYGSYVRLVTNKAPTLTCKQSSDLFTSSSSNIGNEKLINPIGLISADEVVFAGGVYQQNNSEYYLYIGDNYWTMSPFAMNSNSNATMFYVAYSIGINNAGVDFGIKIRPVININGKITLTGTGTIDNPYEISGI